MNDLSDTGGASGEGSGDAGDLRYCLTQANTQPGDDVIQFAVTGAVQLRSALPVLGTNIDIRGPGAGSLVVERRTLPTAFRVFEVAAGATVSIAGLTVRNGSSGGVSNAGTLTLTDCRLVENSPEAVGNAGVLTMAGCDVTGNGGAGVSNAGVLTMTGCAVNGNAGGGVRNTGATTMTGCTVSRNTGGGVRNTGSYSTATGVTSGTLTLDRCVVTDNTAATGGGVSTGAPVGVGFYTSGSLLIVGSTIARNTATRSGGGVSVYAYDTVTVVNSTITGNWGGAMHFQGGSSATLTHVTVAGNDGGITGDMFIRAFVHGPGWEQYGLTLRNSVVADNGGDFGGFLTIGSGSHYNLFGAVGPNAVTGPGGLFNATNQVGSPAAPLDPRLGSLQDNGGPTPTMALLAGRPAIDAGDPDATGLPATDQRGDGFPRVANGRADIGAFEVRAVAVGPESLPTGRVGGGYAQALTATGPAGPYTFAVAAGSLPPGLVLTEPGVLTGTPTAAGVYPFTVTATLGTGESGSRAYTLTIEPAPYSPPVVPVLVGGPADGSAVRMVPAGGQLTIGDSVVFFPGFVGSVRTAVADVTGDGVPDLVGGAGPGGGPAVRVLDGATQAELASFFAFEPGFTGGVYVAAADLDGDGRAEVVVTPDRGGGPVVAVFDATGAERGRFLGIDDPGFRGGARAALGDVNADGTPDLIVSAGSGGGPRVAIFDGATLLAGGGPVKLTGDFFAFEPGLGNGAFVAAGDVTGDGVADLVFGGGPGGAPRVRLFDGKALLAAGPFATLDAVPAAQRADFFADDVGLRGGVRLALKDVAGDGTDDLVTGSGEGEPSRVRVYQGPDLLASAAPAPDQDLDPFAGAVLADGVFVG